MTSSEDRDRFGAQATEDGAGDADGSRNIVLLADGTGNSASKAFKTNVWRLYQGLDLTEGSQIAAFSDGVGTSSFRPFAVIGLALGFGVKGRVLALYKFLCLNYREGDDIYAFGFSRGAFIIRLLVGLVAREGLVEFRSQEELDRNAAAAYRAYLRKTFPARRWQFWVVLGRDLRDLAVRSWNGFTGSRNYDDVRPREGARASRNVTIRFVGVWDTVAAYGLPVDELSRAVNACVWPLFMTFHNLDLLSSVMRARQALSIDDERRTFFPIRWNQEVPSPEAAGLPPRLLQVWFAGVHSNVGGGYPDDRLAHVPLCWMMDEAAESGLRFKPAIFSEYRDYASPTGRAYDSRSGAGIFYRYQPRSARETMGNGVPPIVHGSVLLRMEKGFDGYAPISLPEQIEVLMPSGAMVPFTPATRHTTPQDSIAPEDAAVCEAMERLQQRQRSKEYVELVNVLKDTIWWRRGFYYVTLVLAVLAAAFPVIAGYIGNAGFNQAGSGVLGPVVGLLSGFLPGFAAPWLEAITNNASGAAMLLAALGLCFWLNGFLRRRIGVRAREVWNVEARKDGIELDTSRKLAQRSLSLAGVVIFAALAVVAIPGLAETADTSTTWPALIAFAVIAAGSLVSFFVAGRRGDSEGKQPRLSLLGIARMIRTSGFGLWLYNLLRIYILPGIFLAATTLLVVAAVNKVVFEVMNSGGAFCHIPWKVEGAAAPKSTDVFETKAPCWDSGIELEADVAYRLKLTVGENWKDDNYATDLRGFQASHFDGFRADAIFYFGTPFKRWIGQPYFKTIARVGERGNDEYVLESIKAKSARDEAATVLVADLTPRKSGRLFLYVNDIGIPGMVGKFYDNNVGNATATVTPLAAD